MVNTFLVCADFRQSATYLCRTHLGKQRTEAMQIRNMLLDLDYLAWYFETDAPPRGASKDDIYLWIDELLTLYKGLPYRFVFDRQFNEGVDKQHRVENYFDHYIAVPVGFKYQRAKDTEVFTVEGDFVHVSTKTGLHPRTIPLHEFLFPWQRLLGDGLRKHPVLALWYTYTDALADYINCHIDEWVTRGYKNNMIIYDLPPIVEYPEWCHDPEFHRTIQARLREKEKTWHQEYQDGIRKQKPEVWYTTMDLFLEAGEDTGYLW